MARSKTPWKAPILIFFVSTFCSFMNSYQGCPEQLFVYDIYSKNTYTADKCIQNYYNDYYINMVTRAAPYGFGMYVAYRFNKYESGFLHEQSFFFFEWIALAIVMLISHYGAKSVTLPELDPPVHFVYIMTVRPLYGLCLAYLIEMILSPKPDQTIAYYRPSKYLRWFLSSRFWVPIATTSYSFYIWHLYVLNQREIIRPYFDNYRHLDS